MGIADVHGIVTNPDGLDVERLLPPATPPAAWTAVNFVPATPSCPATSGWPCRQRSVPAAASYVIDESNHHAVHARLVVEAANMPVTPEAEEALAARGVTVSPDFVANSATNAWWWWVFFGDIDGSAEQSFGKISDRIRALSAQMFDYAEHNGVTPRTAAFAVAEQRLDLIEKRFPAL